MPQTWRADVPADQAASPLALASDAVVIVGLSIVTGVFFHLVTRDILGDIPAFTATGIIVAVLFCGMARLQATRDKRASTTRLGRARMAALAWCSTFLFLLTLAFSMKISSEFSRGAIFFFFLAGFAGSIASRVLTPRLLARWMTTNAYRGLEVLIIAPHRSGSTAALFAELAQRGCMNIRAIEFDDACTGAPWAGERRRLLQKVFEVARSAAPGEIYVVAGRLPFDAAASLMSGLRLLPRAVYFVPDEQISALLQNSVNGLGGIVTLEMQKSPLTKTERGIKRAMDVTIAAIALLFTAPLLAAAAVAIKSDSVGPMIFRQTRLGYRGQPFQILKFRTMTVQEDGAVVTQASRNDQRVTRIGKWLRKSSIDELPQLWNVLKGEMSIIGPRPHASAHDAYFAKLIENYEVRQHVKPGLTGWAQVNGLRGETPNLDLMYRRIEADLWYASNCSLGLDFQILIKTFATVVGQENAF
ncbi:MAG: exopolysaccharide biosynthesis polyprenyl glycosylphosphotransferase [Rhizomicrobium sp.]